MKMICFVVGHVHYHLGGAEVQAIRIARELLQRGYEVCYLNNFVRDRDSFPEIEMIDGIEVYNYRCYERFRLFDFFKIRRLVNRINADVYYLRACPFNEGFVTYLAKRQGAKVVWQCASGRSLIKFYKTKNLFRSGKVLSILANISNTICHDFLRLYAMYNAGSLIAQNEENRSTLRNRFNRESVLIHKGIRVDEFQLQKDETELNVLYLRSFRTFSRYELFLEVARRFKDCKHINFAMAGKLYESKQKLLDAIQRSGATYLGLLENNIALKTLETTHILIDTIEEPEGLTAHNTAFLEAWSRNVAVLSFGSNPDNVFEKHNVGYFVKSVDDCVEKIKYLDRHRNVLRKIGSDARDYVLNNHSLDSEVDQLVELL